MAPSEARACLRELGRAIRYLPADLVSARTASLLTKGTPRVIVVVTVDRFCAASDEPCDSRLTL